MSEIEIKPVPTLYVKNLNDKIKIEGKCRAFNQRACRVKDSFISLVQYIWRGYLSQDEVDVAIKGTSIHCIQGISECRFSNALLANLLNFWTTNGKCLLCQYGWC
jgi:hypothetical protein